MKKILKKNKSMKQILIFQFSSVVIASIIILSITSLVSFKNNILSTTLNIMETVAQQSSELVSSEIDKSLVIGEELAQSIVRKYLEDNHTHIHNTDGIDDEHLDEENNSLIHEILNDLNYNAEKYGYINIGIGDLDGNLIFNDGTKENLKGQDFYEKALSGELSIKEPRYLDTVNQVIVAHAIPIKNSNNNVEGVIVFNRPGDYISSLIKGVSFLKSGQAFMISNTGVVIADHNQEVVNNQINVVEEAKKNSQTEELLNIYEKMIAGDLGTGTYKENGIEKAISYSPIEATGWSIGISVEYSDILSGIFDTVKKNVLISFIIIVLSTFICISFSSRITKGIKEFLEVLKSISEGDFTVELDKKHLHGLKEMNDMADGINNLKNGVSQMILEVKGKGNILVMKQIIY